MRRGQQRKKCRGTTVSTKYIPIAGKLLIGLEGETIISVKHTPSSLGYTTWSGRCIEVQILWPLTCSPEQRINAWFPLWRANTYYVLSIEIEGPVAVLKKQR